MKKYQRTRVFISYSREDFKWRDQLCKHLEPLRRDQKIDVWDDRKIRPGDVWEEEIKKAIDSAKMAVVLISKNYFASDFISSVELPLLLAAAKKERTPLIQVIIGTCDIGEELSGFQSVNPPSKPLEGMRNEVKRDGVFVKLCKEIKPRATLLMSWQRPEP